MSRPNVDGEVWPAVLRASLTPLEAAASTRGMHWAAADGGLAGATAAAASAALGGGRRGSGVAAQVPQLG